MQDDQTASISWRDGIIPVSTQFDDPYFSLASGLEETRHVFIAGNDLPARLRDGFHIAELGFGTGLNMLAVALAYQGEGAIRFTSFEAFPMTTPDIAQALDAFPEARAIADPFLDAWAEGKRRFRFGQIDVDVKIGDARETLSTWDGMADAWFLDGFSPAKNPELWGEDLMLEVGRHTATGGTFATYTAAGHVRQKLGDAGFEVERTPGFGRKRHMSRGVKS
ncbi:tRNA (5-methylaminomethyl-2-thiouridine)(34)-methyltransferase MnmD [Celeribacter litoreus]|uniref:tRNA (5-methylaminomethyl-2-thiouridine)(34)-methyltransferase MnmD n=1 Tax=Celeribacter litoreus TaxID=2876714 RepID=UPI001CCB2A97|nr:tRNA (5-methylaminomethyl-2-thiouridine)(34)-methyltransferase MnmD [Celeribacter litoreus]MCA0042316.1 tRNA (5-methylaminomethyl-2-thiouridine)(34)-methyltransferase MnmD [Celeribacter litoreus]